jgi:hypothetical protein
VNGRQAEEAPSVPGTDWGRTGWKGWKPLGCCVTFDAWLWGEGTGAKLGVGNALADGGGVFGVAMLVGVVKRGVLGTTGADWPAPVSEVPHPGASLTLPRGRGDQPFIGRGGWRWRTSSVSSHVGIRQRYRR